MPMRYPGIESATRYALDALDIDYVDIPEFSCCPAPGVTRSFDKKTWLALGARNLVAAEKAGVDIITICNGCYGSLFDVAHELNTDDEKRAAVNEILGKAGLEYNGTVEAYHFAGVLYNEIGVDTIRERVTQPMDMTTAVHYGCHFLKPSKLKQLDDPERPKILDEIVEALGFKSLDYKDKQMCCGAGGGVRARASDVALKITKEKLDNVQDVSADCIINGCPFCHLQYDRGQQDLEGDYAIPVFHLSQVLAYAFGADESLLGLNQHATSASIENGD